MEDDRGPRESRHRRLGREGELADVSSEGTPSSTDLSGMSDAEGFADGKFKPAKVKMDVAQKAVDHLTLLNTMTSLMAFNREVNRLRKAGEDVVRKRGYPALEELHRINKVLGRMGGKS